MLGLKLVDWVVIVVYLFGITLIGFWAVRKVQLRQLFHRRPKVR